MYPLGSSPRTRHILHDLGTRCPYDDGSRIPNALYGVDALNCPDCGRANTTRSRYCRFCGTALLRPKRRLQWGRLSAVAGAALVFIGGVYLYRATRHLPSVNHLVSAVDSSPSSLVYDASGHVIARLGGPDHHLTPINAISPHMKAAMVAIEDHNFYHNPGFDLRSIARAAWVDLIHHSAVQGASTITEQLAKDLYLSDKKSLTRKVQEFVIGLELAHHYSKAEILDLYLNEVYFGQGADGIGAAAHVYFDTTAAKLTLAQATMLAGLPQAPSLYDPLVNPKLAQERQTQVVQAMVRYGDISAAEGRRILETPLHFHPEPAQKAQNGFPDPWYIDQVVAELRAHGMPMNQIMNGGLHIHTALRPQVYAIAQQAVDQWMAKNFGESSKLYPDHQAAVVVENPHNGHVWAIIGGRRHFTFLQDDLAVQASRSTGSSIKPLLDYAPALARGYTQMSVLQDVPIFKNVSHQTWWPQNDDYIYRGYMDLRDALAISDNDVAVHLLNRIGIPYAVQFLQQRFGIAIPTAEARGLGIALGVDTNLLHMTTGYAALDNAGTRTQPVFVTRVTSGKKVLFSAHPTATRAVTAGQAAILTQMMQRVLDPNPLPSIGPNADATGHLLNIGRPAAGKTGTNNNEADAWFVGYEPQMVVGVWEGDRLGEIAQPYTKSNMGPAYGAVAAGPIWKQVMQSVNQALHLKPASFPRPPGLVYVPRVSITSGKLPSRYTPQDEIQGAWFVQGTQPIQHDATWHPVHVAAFDPTLLWEPGCGPNITRVALTRESDWHPGVPKPWDAFEWAPTVRCQPFQGPPGHGPGHGHGPGPGLPFGPGPGRGHGHGPGGLHGHGPGSH